MLNSSQSIRSISFWTLCFDYLLFLFSTQDLSITLPLSSVAWPAAITLQIVWVRQRQGLAICHLIPTWKRNNSWDRVIVEPRMIVLCPHLSASYFSRFDIYLRFKTSRKMPEKEISIWQTINSCVPEIQNIKKSSSKQIQSYEQSTINPNVTSWRWS